MSFISLDGTWQLTSPQYPDIKAPISIPGDNHNALLQAGLIPDPYVATNEKEVQWVSQSDWVIQSSFEIDEQDLDCKSLELTLSRVDTLAEIWINEHHVLSCSNMFCQYKVDIKPYVKLGSNQIEVRFSRADQEAQRRADKQPFFIPWAVAITKCRI